LECFPWLFYLFYVPTNSSWKKGEKITAKGGQATIGDISSLLNETIRGIKVIKSFTNEEKEKSDLDKQ